MTEDQKILDKHIKLWEKERKKYDELITSANQFKYSITKGVNKFECPEGLSNKEAICGKCDKAFPVINTFRSKMTITYPNKFTKTVDNIDLKGRTCGEWEKKIIFDACGCGGRHTCICGYEASFCIKEESRPCPFCKKMTKVEYSPNIITSLSIANNRII